MRNQSIHGDASCYGKKVYKTYWQAQRAGKRLNRSRDQARVHPYKCNSCGFYHVGNGMNNKRQTPRRHNLKDYSRGGRG